MTILTKTIPAINDYRNNKGTAMTNRSTITVNGSKFIKTRLYHMKLKLQHTMAIITGMQINNGFRLVMAHFLQVYGHAKTRNISSEIR